MAKGSVRKKGKKWYYRFYVEDASGKFVQKEYAGTESKSETEKMLRQAMDEYDSKKFVARNENITLGMLLDIWAEEELKTGSLANGTVQLYLHSIKRLHLHPISKRKLSTVTSEHLQGVMDLVTFGGKEGDFDAKKGYKKDYANTYHAILNQAFRFAVFPKKYITFNPMQYCYWGELYMQDAMPKIADYTQKYHDKHPGEPVKIGFLPPSIWNFFQYQMEYDFQYGEHFYDLTWNNGYSHKQILSDIKVPCVYLHAKESKAESGVYLCAASKEQADRAVSYIDNCTFIETTTSDHSIHEVHKDVYIDAVNSLLK